MDDIVSVDSYYLDSNYIDKEYEYCNLTVIGENETYSIVCFKDCSYNYLDILNFINIISIIIPNSTYLYFKKHFRIFIF